MEWKFRLLVVFILGCGVAAAQNVLDFTHEPIIEKYNVLELNTELDYFSDNIQNSLITNLVLGGGIDRNSLNSMLENMDGQNAFGGWTDIGLRYRTLSDSVLFKKNRSLFLEFGMAQYGYASFPKDLFHFMFLGNADKLGETLQMSNMTSEVMKYQYAGLGVMNESTGSYLSFNLINVQNYFSSDLEEFTIYTAEDASEVQLSYAGTLITNDTLRGNFLSNSGAGITLNGRYNMQLRENQGLFSIEVRNIGAVRLNDRTRQFKADSSWNYSGVNVNELFSSDNGFTSITIEDSLAYTDEQKTKTVWMPLDINANYFHRINKSDHIGFSVRKRFFTHHNADLGVNYLHNESDMVGYNIGLSYGGYGGLRMNAGAHFNFENWRFHLITRNLVGAFIESGKGRSASFGISRTFRQAP